MPDFSKEGADIKRRFLKIYDEWENEFYDGAKIRKTPKNPKGGGITKGRAHRGLYSLLMSPDDVHLDYIDNRMSKGATVKSMMGGLGGRVQKLTEGASSPYSVHPNDSMHHGNNHSSYGRTARIQDQNLLRNWLQISSDNGEVYGEGEGNLKGNSQDVRSHLGSRGKGGKKFNPTHAGYGPEGETALSSHPRGSTDAETAIEHKKYDSAKEMFDAGADVRKIHKQDLAIGTAADKPRRDFLNQKLSERGVIKPGDDAWSADFPTENIAAVKKAITADKDLMIKAAKAWNPELARKIARDFESGGYALAMDPFTPAIKQGYQLLKNNKVGTALGAIQDPKIVDQLEQGDFKGAGLTAASNGTVGALAQQGLKALVTAAPKLAPVANTAGPVVAGGALFAEGKKGSFTDKAVNALDKHVNSKLPTRNDPSTDIGKRSGEFLAKDGQETVSQLQKFLKNPLNELKWGLKILQSGM